MFSGILYLRTLNFFHKVQNDRKKRVSMCSEHVVYKKLFFFILTFKKNFALMFWTCVFFLYWTRNTMSYCGVDWCKNECFRNGFVNLWPNISSCSTFHKLFVWKQKVACMEIESIVSSQWGIIFKGCVSTKIHFTYIESWPVLTF